MPIRLHAPIFLALIESECLAQLVRERLGPTSLALPKRQHAPTCVNQRSLLLLISRGVAIKFLPPELDTSFRHRGLATTRMTVPEAAVDENRRSVLRQDDIGRAGQAAALKPEPEPQPMQKLTNDHLWAGVSLPDGAHDAAARSVYRIVGVWGMV